MDAPTHRPHHPSPAQREPLSDAQLAQGLRAAIDIPTAHEAAAFRKGARWAWARRLRAELQKNGMQPCPVDDDE